MMWFPDQNGPVHRRHRSPPLNKRHRHQQHQQSVRRHSLRRAFGPNVTVHPLAGLPTGHRLQLQQEGQQPAAAVSRRHSGSISSWPRIPSSTPPIYRRPCVCRRCSRPARAPSRSSRAWDLKPERSRSWRIEASALRRQPVGRRRLGGDQAGLLQQHHQELHHPLLRSGPDGPDDLQQHRQLPHQRSRTAIALRRRAVFADLSATYS